MGLTSKEYRILFNKISDIIELAKEAQISAENLVICSADNGECDERNE